MKKSMIVTTAVATLLWITPFCQSSDILLEELQEIQLRMEKDLSVSDGYFLEFSCSTKMIDGSGKPLKDQKYHIMSDGVSSYLKSDDMEVCQDKKVSVSIDHLRKLIFICNKVEDPRRGAIIDLLKSMQSNLHDIYSKAEQEILEDGSRRITTYSSESYKNNSRVEKTAYTINTNTGWITEVQTFYVHGHRLRSAQTTYAGIKRSKTLPSIFLKEPLSLCYEGRDLKEQFSGYQVQDIR